MRVASELGLCRQLGKVRRTRAKLLASIANSEKWEAERGGDNSRKRASMRSAVEQLNGRERSLQAAIRSARENRKARTSEAQHAQP